MLSANKMAVVISSLIGIGNYREVVLNATNELFIKEALELLEIFASAKAHGQEMTAQGGWLHDLVASSSDHDVEYRSIFAGLNKKTIHNLYGTSNRQRMIEVSLDNLKSNYVLIETLDIPEHLKRSKTLDLKLSIILDDRDVELNLNETLLAITAIAVKRAATVGSLWSAVGKRAEKPLMKALCILFGVPAKHFTAQDHHSDPEGRVQREVDFYLTGPTGEKHRCEVKLMGKGNPESADVAYARGTDIFIADTLSDKNIAQLEQENVHWVALAKKDGFMRFGKVLRALKIPHRNFEAVPSKADIDEAISKALA